MSICASPCSIFLSRAYNETPPQPSDVNRVFYYDFSANTITPIQTTNFTGFFDCGDIANTSNRLWLNNNTTNKIWEYSLGLCPLSTSFIRQINVPTTTFGGLGKGLTAINNNNLITAGQAPNPKLPIYRTNIAGSTAVNTLLFFLPNGRFICEDILYVALPSSGAKIILTNYKFSTTGTTGFFLTQYDANSGLLEMDKFIPSNLISEPKGLFTRGNKIYITDAGNGNVWSVGLTNPYPLTLVQQIPDQTTYYTNGTGASTSPECNKTSFRPQPFVSSFPGIVAIDQNTSCDEWVDPSIAKQIYVSPVGPIVAGETKFYLNESRTDSVERGLWVSDGTLTYLMGDDGVVEESYECGFTIDNVISFDPVGGIDSTVRLYSNNSALNPQSTVSGGINNTASGNGSTISGGYLNTAANCCSTIAGGSLNLTGAEYSFIGGGRMNTTDDSYSIVVGGENNFAGCECSFVGGGQFNSSTYQFSNVVGGLCNLAGADHGSILGGFNNSVIGACSSILGGDNNTAFSDSTVIGGGANNQSYSTYGTIAGGSGNKIYLDGATVVGGQNNTAIQYNSTVVGGFGNFVDGACSLVGGNSNTVSGTTSFVLSNGSTLNANNSAIIGGVGILGDTDSTVYVPQLNIGILNTGTSVNNLGIDSDGFVIVGTDVSGATSSLTEVLTVGNSTDGNDIIISTGDYITSPNGEGKFTISDSGDGGQINLSVTDTSSTLFSQINQKNNTIGIGIQDNVTFDQSSVSVGPTRVQLTTPENSDNSVYINGFNYGFAQLITTGNTPEIIYTLPSSAIANDVTQVNAWCSARNVGITSGLTEELVLSFLFNGVTLSELTTAGATTAFSMSTFANTVTTSLSSIGTDVVVRVTGYASTTIEWSCKVRWSV